ncbi:hypothetical protein BGY98DRAFT_985232 [Russula aff. rugulosa BPL654]|nr:hypothetical protein BGY98DRAFT_985232 [Russula aff. rugulosa BPL654]
MKKLKDELEKVTADLCDRVVLGVQISTLGHLHPTMTSSWLMIGHAVRQKVEGVLVRSRACGRRGCKYQYSGPFGRIHHSGTRGKY